MMKFLLEGEFYCCVIVSVVISKMTFKKEANIQQIEKQYFGQNILQIRNYRYSNKSNKNNKQNKNNNN